MPPDAVTGLRLPGMKINPFTMSGGHHRQRDRDFAAMHSRNGSRTVPSSRGSAFGDFPDTRFSTGRYTSVSTLEHSLPDIEHFATMCALGKGGKMLHPGLVLPQRLSTTQSLFRGRALGTPGALKEVSSNMHVGAPRYQTHDVPAMSSCVHANFRRTRLNFIEAPPVLETEQQAMYRRPSRQGHRPGQDPRRAQSCGARLEVWAGNPLSIHSGSGRVAL